MKYVLIGNKVSLLVVQCFNCLLSRLDYINQTKTREDRSIGQDRQTENRSCMGGTTWDRSRVPLPSLFINCCLHCGDRDQSLASETRTVLDLSCCPIWSPKHTLLPSEHLISCLMFQGHACSQTAASSHLH